MALQIEGYTIYLLKCADGSYYSGMCKDMTKELSEINKNKRLSGYFLNRSQLLPVTIVFQEDHVPFKEAFAKHRTLRAMTKRYRDRLIRTKKWPVSTEYKKFLEKNG